MEVPGPHRPLNAQVRGSNSRLPIRPHPQTMPHVPRRMPSGPTSDRKLDSGGARSETTRFNTPTPKSSSDTLVTSATSSPKDSVCGDSRRPVLKKTKDASSRCGVGTVDRSPRGQLPTSSINAVLKTTAGLHLTPDLKPPVADSNFLASQEQDRNPPTLASGSSNETAYVLQPSFAVAVAAQERGGVPTVDVDHTPTSCPADRGHDRAPPSFQPYPAKSTGTPSKKQGSQKHPLKTTKGKNTDAPRVDVEQPRKGAKKPGLPCWHHYHYTNTPSSSDFTPLEGCHNYDSISQIPRHSCAHKAYICIKCVRNFPTEEAYDGHECVPACRNSSCKRNQEPGRGRPKICPSHRPCLTDSPSRWWAVLHELFGSHANGTHDHQMMHPSNGFPAGGSQGHQTMHPSNGLPAGPTHGTLMGNSTQPQPPTFGAENGFNRNLWLHAGNIHGLDADWQQNNPNTTGLHTIQFPQNIINQPYHRQQAMPTAPTPSSLSNTNFPYPAPSYTPAFPGVDSSQTANTNLQQGDTFFTVNHTSLAGPSDGMTADNDLESHIAAAGWANQAGPTLTPGFDSAMPNDMDLYARTAIAPVHFEDNPLSVRSGETLTPANPQPVPESVGGPEQDAILTAFYQLATMIASRPDTRSRRIIIDMVNMTRRLYEQDTDTSQTPRSEKDVKHDSGVDFEQTPVGGGA